MPRLIFTNPEFAGQSCELTDGIITLGRSRQNLIVVLDDSVSSRHCEFHVQRNEVIVRDLGSRNGTYVEDVRLNPQRGVRHAQRLRLGKVEARLQLDVFPEDESNTTAYHDHCQRVRAADNPAPCYPVVIAVPRPNASEELTRSLPAESAPPAPTADTSLIQRPRPGWTWQWGILLALAIALGLLWWFTRTR